MMLLLSCTMSSPPLPVLSLCNAHCARVLVTTQVLSILSTRPGNEALLPSCWQSLLPVIVSTIQAAPFAIHVPTTLRLLIVPISVHIASELGSTDVAEDVQPVLSSLLSLLGSIAESYALPGCDDALYYIVSSAAALACVQGPEEPSTSPAAYKKVVTEALVPHMKSVARALVFGNKSARVYEPAMALLAHLVESDAFVTSVGARPDLLALLLRAVDAATTAFLSNTGVQMGVAALLHNLAWTDGVAPKCLRIAEYVRTILTKHSKVLMVSRLSSQ